MFASWKRLREVFWKGGEKGMELTKERGRKEGSEEKKEKRKEKEEGRGGRERGKQKKERGKKR